MSIKSRKDAPTKKLSWAEHQAYRVWIRKPIFMEDTLPWKCAATFAYLLDALEYIASCQDAGEDVVFQSPANCETFNATGRRAVYKPEGNK